MFSFEYQSNNYRHLLSRMAYELGVSLQGDTLIYPKEVATGYSTVFELPNGLQAILSDYTLNDHFYMKRIKEAEEFYVLRYEEFRIAEELTLKIDGEILSTRNELHSGVYLTSSLFDLSYFGRKGSHNKSLNITFNKNWLADHLHIKDPEEVLSTYLQLKTASFTMEPIDNEYRRYFNHVPRWWPDWSAWHPGTAHLSFNWQRVLAKEYHRCFLLVGALAGVNWWTTWRIAGSSALPSTTGMMAMILAWLACYASGRYLKKAGHVRG